MDFNRHYIPDGRHAELSASKYHWVNYDEEKLERYWKALKAAKRGTDIHKYAHDAIKLRMKQPTRPRTTVGLYVNDGIGFQMTPEQPLVYSDNAFGTADCISFRKNKLRISDLKTGISRVSFMQLMVYVALFCLEYGYSPFEIEIELRIYQNNDVEIFVPDPAEIQRIIDVTIKSDQLISEWKREEA